MTPFAQDVTRVAPTIVKQHTPYDEYMNERNKPTTRQVIDNALDETAKAGKWLPAKTLQVLSGSESMPQTKAEALNQAGLGVAYAMGAELIGPLVGRVVGGLRSAVKAAKALRKPKVNTYTSNSIASKYAKFDNATIRTATEEDLARFETDILPKLEEELMELYSSPEAIRQAEINSGIARRSKSRSIRNKEGINREEGILGSGPTANDAELYTKRLQERVTLDGPIEQWPTNPVIGNYTEEGRKIGFNLLHENFTGTEEQIMEQFINTYLHERGHDIFRGHSTGSALRARNLYNFEGSAGRELTGTLNKDGEAMTWGEYIEERGSEAAENALEVLRLAGVTRDTKYPGHEAMLRVLESARGKGKDQVLNMLKKANNHDTYMLWRAGTGRLLNTTGAVGGAAVATDRLIRQDGNKEK